MRCKCCDWSPNGPQSDYNRGVAANGRKNHLILDKLTGDTICNVCALVVALDLAREKGEKL